ncbi:leucine-rich repeat protein lrrA-like [Hyla sarda]|uniref:leucine-rich repeat protein lrrA-like n=1 Tax=Hyla sarda TaxID=327740 RepID=UPI0024C23FD9|nr:leucine-rich repeat protein lrrA-like [Hyla sarda]
MDTMWSTPTILTYKKGWKTLVENSLSGRVHKKIKVEGKELSCPPLDIFSLEDMHILKMSPERESCLSYRMNFVPMQIGGMRNLRVLLLDTNHLEEVPPEIGSLRYLQRLTLSNNSLRFLPTELAKLQNLHSVHLANNQFVTFPIVLCQLLNLNFLDLSDNGIEMIPPSIQQLRRLNTFLLMLNFLTSLPEEFCSLTKLSCLWLGNNKLQELPKTFGNLVMLDWGHDYCSCNIEGNPLRHPPVEVCNRGPKEIQEYLDSCK